LEGKKGVIGKLQEARLHPLKRHDSLRLAEIVEDEGEGVGREIVALVGAMERAAIGLIWPSAEADAN